MRIAIVHPWLPQYRAPFFDQLRRDAASVGIEVRVFYGSPPLEWAARGDSVSDSAYKELPTKFLPIGGRSFNYKSLSPLFAEGPWDLVIVEQAIRNLETYILLAKRQHLAFWGHGKTYTKRVSNLQERLKVRLTNFGCWFFAYTHGGAEAVARSGFPVNKITVVQNTIDSTLLRNSIDALTTEEVSLFAAKHALKDATALFIGGLDESKRLEFLVESSIIVRDQLPGFRLLVAGDGAERPYIERMAKTHDHILYLGRVGGREKALALSAADVIAMPGRVGLLAVDSFTAGRPIVTTAWPWHAPEFEYLTPDVDSIVSDDSEEAFASALAATLSDRKALKSLQDGCLDSSPSFTIEEMSKRFLDGVIQALESSPR